MNFHRRQSTLSDVIYESSCLSESVSPRADTLFYILADLRLTWLMASVLFGNIDLLYYKLMEGLVTAQNMIGLKKF